jgi:ribosomal protein L30
MALKVTYTKSAIGYAKDQKATVRSLGLRKLHQSVVHHDTPVIRGMVFKVRHLVTVEETDAPVTVLNPRQQRRAAQPATTPAPASEVAKPAPATSPAPVPAAKPVVPPVAAQADDLEVIEGIGPKIAEVLQAAGITSFAQLAATDVSQLQEILQQANVRRVTDPASWPEQAELAAAGKTAELEQLQASLKAGRRQA